MPLQRARVRAVVVSTCLVSVLLCLSTAGCGGAPSAVVLHPEVTRGPATVAAGTRVLALRAFCGSAEYPCPPEYADTVDAIVRGGIERWGYQVVASEQLVKETRARHETRTSETTTDAARVRTDHSTDLSPFNSHTTTDTNRVTRKEGSTVTLDGSTFADLTPDEQREVITSARTDSVLTVRVVVGGQLGVWVPNQNVEVMVKLAAKDGDAMAWASRCTASSNDFATVSGALEHAARCAVQGGRTFAGASGCTTTRERLRHATGSSPAGVPAGVERL